MEVVSQMMLVGSYLLHSVVKNVLMGGAPIVAATYYRGRRGRGHPYYVRLADTMMEWASTIVTLTAVFGGIAMLIVMLHYDWHFMAGGTAEGVTWTMLGLLLGGAYGGLRWLRRAAQPSEAVAAAGIVAGCAVAATFMFVSAHVGGIPDASPTLWPRLWHAVCGSLAVTGCVLTLWGLNRPPAPEDNDGVAHPYDTRLVRYGMGWMLAGTVPQVVVGPWFVLMLSPDVRAHLVSGTTAGSLIFFVSLTSTLLALVLMNASLMVPQKKGLVVSGLGSLIVTIVLMTCVREDLRLVSLGRHGSAAVGDTISWITVLCIGAFAAAGLFLATRYVAGSRAVT